MGDRLYEDEVGISCFRLCVSALSRVHIVSDNHKCFYICSWSVICCPSAIEIQLHVDSCRKGMGFTVSSSWFPATIVLQRGRAIENIKWKAQQQISIFSRVNNMNCDDRPPGLTDCFLSGVPWDRTPLPA